MNTNTKHDWCVYFLIVVVIILRKTFAKSNWIFSHDILAQDCSLVEWILVLLTMMQCSCEVTLQGS